MDKKLQDCFSNIDYSIDRMRLTDNKRNFELAGINFKAVDQSVEEFKAGLRARKLENSNPHVEFLLRALAKFLQVLDEYFSGQINLKLNALDDYVDHVKKTIQGLNEIAIEIDAEQAKKKQ